LDLCLIMYILSPHLGGSQIEFTVQAGENRLDPTALLFQGMAIWKYDMNSKQTYSHLSPHFILWICLQVSNRS
jgi:hypothetical protein